MKKPAREHFYLYRRILYSKLRKFQKAVRVLVSENRDSASIKHRGNIIVSSIQSSNYHLICHTFHLVPCFVYLLNANCPLRSILCIVYTCTTYISPDIFPTNELIGKSFAFFFIHKRSCDNDIPK